LVPHGAYTCFRYKMANTVLSPKQRLKLVERVFKEDKLVASACQEFGVSRFTFYKWAKRYDKSASRNQNLRNLADIKRRVKLSKNIASSNVVAEVKKIVLNKPSLSKYEITNELKKRLANKALGVHGVYNILKRSGLNTFEDRKKWQQFVLSSKRRTLTPGQRLEVIRRAEQLRVPIAQVCRDIGISRYTFYKWKRRWEKSSKNIDALRDRKPQYDRRRLRIQPELEKEILSIVIEFPNLSKYGIARRLSDKLGPVVGPHGVYNVLLRNGLNIPELRLAYSRAYTPEVSVKPGVSDRIRYVLEQFVTSLAPAPPPRLAIALAPAARTFFNFLKTFSITSIISSATIYSFLWWISLLKEQFVNVSIGLIFATVALFMGSIFFLYSLKYYITLAIVLSFSQQESSFAPSTSLRASRGRKGFLSWILGFANGGSSLPRGVERRGVGLTPNLEHITLKRYPKVSVHIPLYNEKNVVERAIKAATNFDYPGDYEVILCDDSTDETTQIIKDYLRMSNHRTSRQGFKGGALRLALKCTDPKAEFVSVFDADFVPYPDTLTLFLKYFKAVGGWQEERKWEVRNGKVDNEVGSEKDKSHLSPQYLASHIQPHTSNIAAVQGYQWHVLNKSENWITRGVRSEYAGSYVIERSGTEIYSGLKQISGAVYMIRRDVLEEVGWETSITEDFQLTLKLYEAGYKVVYTPYIQAPAECVSTLKRLIRQRMRWAEGHSNNVRKMFTRLLFGHWGEVISDSSLVTSERKNTNHQSPITNHRRWTPSPLTLSEKLEFLYLSPYYLQAFFFLLGTISWLISETIFATRLPFWTSLWGWSLVLTNMLSLPLLNSVGLFLEESDERDYSGILSFVALSYILVPFQAYAALKGFLSRQEGPWFRTPKTGRITDVFSRGRFYRFISGILPGRTQPALQALGTRQLGNSFLTSAQSLMPNAYHEVTSSAYLSLATANNQFYNPQIRPRKIKWVSKATLSLLLVLVMILNYLSFFTPKAYAQAADPTIEQQINIIDQEFSTTSSTASPTDNSLGLVNWDADDYNGEAVYFEAIIRCTSCSGGNAETDATLYTEGGSAVTGATVSTTSSSYSRVRSSAITGNLVDGTDYTVRLARDATSGTAYIKAARLIIVQSDATMLTNTAHHIEIGNKDEMFGARVQRGSQSITAGTTSSTATVTTVDTGRSFLICSPGENTSTGPDDLTYTCELTNSTTITFTRPSGNGGTLTIRWQLIEYDNIRVQTSTVSMASGTGSTSYTIPTAVDTAKTFMTMTILATSTTAADNIDRYVSANISSATNVNFTRAQNTGAVTVRFFIVEFLDETFVEQWSGLTIADTATSDTATISGPAGSGVDIGRSFLVGYTQSTSTSGGMDDTTVRIELTNGTTVTATRPGAAGANTIEGWVIELPKEGTGDNGAMVEAASQGDLTASPTNITLSNSFDENRSFVWGSATDDGGGTAWDRAELGFQLTSPTNFQLTTGDVANVDTFRGFAVQLPDWRAVTNPKIYTFDSTKFSGTLTANFEGTLRSNQATASASLRLYNITDNEAVTSSTVSVSGTTWDRQLSSGLTVGASAGNLKSGKEYVMQLNYVSGVEAQSANSKLVLTQTDAGGLTSMEIIHHYVNTLATDTDSTYTDQDYLNQYDPGNFVGGTFTYNFEATLKTSAGTGYAKLKNDTDGNEIDDDAGCSGDGNPTSEITTDGTDDNDYDRIKSAALGAACDWPTAAKNMDTIAKNSAASGNTTSVSNSWLIITVSNLQIPENLLLFIPAVLFLPFVIKRFRTTKPFFAPLASQNGITAAGRKNKIGYRKKVIEDG